jgi:TRAP-type transport system periplasmic protein
VKVVEMNDEQIAKWRKIADETSYKAFADEVPGGRELLDMALSVE